MAARNSRVADAIALLGEDGVIVSPDDYNKFEALIGDYFNESECDSDESGSDEEMECGKYVFLSWNAFTQLQLPCRHSNIQ